MAKVEVILAPKKSYYTPAQGAAYYGRSRKLEEIVLHHWDDKNLRNKGKVSFAGVYNHLMTAGVPSANDMIGYDERVGKIRVINQVKYPNVAFTTGSMHTARGKYVNQVSVGFEIDPLIEITDHKQRAGLIEAVAQRCFDYCKIADKRLPLTAHRDYALTACPGDMPLGKINAQLDELWKEHKTPAPKPTPKPTPKPVPTPVLKIKYRKLDKRIWLTVKQPTNMWDLGFTKFADAKSVKFFDKNTAVEIVGIADHPLGTQYLMTAYSFGEADKTGKPAHNTGFNKVDMKQQPAPTPEAPAKPPITDPKPDPTPTPPPSKPITDAEHEAQQDKDIAWLKGTVNSLLALWRDFLSKIGKE